MSQGIHRDISLTIGDRRHSQVLDPGPWATGSSLQSLLCGPAANWVQAERVPTARGAGARGTPLFELRGECLSTHLSQPFSWVGSASSSTTPSGPDKTSKLRERDQQEKGTTAWNGQCELQLVSQVGGPTLLGGTTLEVPSRTPERLNIVA